MAVREWGSRSACGWQLARSLGRRYLVVDTTNFKPAVFRSASASCTSSSASRCRCGYAS
jgi:hypothetical protein